MGNDYWCNIEGIGTVHIKMFDGIAWELKEVRYIPQLKRKLISVGALETLGFEVSIKDGVFKMTKGSMVVLKGVRRNNCWNLYFDDNNCDADALELYLKKLMLSSNCSRLLKDIGYFFVFFIEC